MSFELDSWLTRQYERFGAKYVWGAVAATAGGTAVIYLVAISAGAEYLNLTLGEALQTIFLLLGLVIGSIALGLALNRDFKLIAAWASGEQTGELRQSASTWAFRVPRRAIFTMYTVGLPGAVPILLLTLLGPASASVPEAFAIFLMTGIVAMLAMIMSFAVFEVALRPLRREVGSFDATDAGRLSATAILIAVPTVACMGVTLVAGLLVLDRESAADLSLLGFVGIDFALSLGLGLLVVVANVAMVNGPIRDLVRATKNVAAGASEPRIPITSTDEFGDLTASFNQMVDDLDRGRAELQASRTRIVAANDEGRRKVERDLHDGAQQSLVLMNLKLGLLRKELEGRKAEPMVEALQADLNAALSELRDLAHGIYPQVLTSDGVAAALVAATVDSAIPANVESDGLGRYPEEIEAAVYFCCLEALQNAAKYAGGGASVRVTLSEAEGKVRFEVADDGAGFDPAGANGSAGLQNMADRIGALGGELRVESKPGEGARVAGSVPAGG